VFAKLVDHLADGASRCAARGGPGGNARLRSTGVAFGRDSIRRCRWTAGFRDRSAARACSVGPASAPCWTA
jgi:hypothetical protein